MNRKKQKGYIAIASVLVIAAIVLVIGLTVGLSSINEVQMALSGIKSDNGRNILEGCAEEALLRLNELEYLPPTITTPDGTCTAQLVTHNGTEWEFDVSGTFDQHTKTITISAIRDSTITITKWQEN